MTYTAATLQQAIGQTVLVRVESWKVPMIVTDAKTSYGNPRVQVTPIHGTGSAWIDLSRNSTATQEVTQ